MLAHQHTKVSMLIAKHFLPPCSSLEYVCEFIYLCICFGSARGKQVFKRQKAKGCFEHQLSYIYTEVIKANL